MLKKNIMKNKQIIYLRIIEKAITLKITEQTIVDVILALEFSLGEDYRVRISF